MNIQMRKAVASDALGIHNAHMSSIREMCSSEYSEEQIKAWGGRAFEEEKWVYSINKQQVWVATVGETVEGYCHVIIRESVAGKYGELAGLYITPKIIGRGVGKTFLQLAENLLKEQGIERLVTRSTKTAKEFYLSQGFFTNHDDASPCFSGVSIECIGMEKKLNED